MFYARGINYYNVDLNATSLHAEVDAVNKRIEDLAGITIALCDPSPMNSAALAIEITTFIVSKMDNLPEEEAREHAADIVFRHLEGFLSKAICEENPEEGDCQ